jgi:ribonucleoside-diphosphate reductase alpha chain
VQPFISGAISKTVNMPENATVADVAEIYQQGWKMGLKALAIYRDNCKVGQPLSASNKNHGEKSADASVNTAVESAPAPIVTGPVRRRLPKKRPSQTVSFTVGGAEGYLTTGSYPDDGLGEVFIKLGKQGSTLAGVMDAFSIAVSVGLQYGIPLESYVAKFTNLRFEPAGMTDDPDVRIATSVMDYLFRRIALDYLPVDARAELGIFSAEERTAQVSASYGGDTGSDAAHVVEDLRTTVDATPVVRPAVEGGTTGSADSTAGGSAGSAEPVKASLVGGGRAGSSTELLELVIGKSADAPLCFTCGTKMRPSGACYLCEGCGSTSGCS